MALIDTAGDATSKTKAIPRKEFIVFSRTLLVSDGRLRPFAELVVSVFQCDVVPDRGGSKPEWAGGTSHV